MKKTIIILYVSMCICSVFAMQDVDLTGYECKESVIENEYYDRIDMYYNTVEIEYNGTILQAISDYYLVAYKNGEKYVLGQVTIEESGNESKINKYDKNGNVFSDTSIAGPLYYQETTDGNVVVYGFMIKVLSAPLNPQVLMRNRNSTDVYFDSAWPIIIDEKNNTIKNFSPFS